MRKCQCFIFVYDITDERSFNELEGQIKRLKQTKEFEPISVIIVGNKCDLEEERKVKEDNAKEYALKKGYLFIEASAKSSKNINQIFKNVVLEFAPRFQVKKPEKKRRSGIFQAFVSTSSDD